MNVQPRDYQIEGINWLLGRKRAMLRDDVGLGKTLQAVGASQPPVLVLCPNFLVQGWGQWLRNEGGSDSVAVASGSRIQRLNALRSGADFVVANYEILKSHGEYLFEWNETGKRPVGVREGWPWRTLILDESHYIRNPTAKRSRAVAVLAHHVEYVYELTATPIWKEADDLWMQFHVLDPELFSSYHEFVDMFCVSQETRFGRKVLGVRKSMMPELEQILNTMSLYRTYKDVGRELPPIIEDEVKLELPPKVRSLYKQVQDYYIDEVELGFSNYSQVMHALRQITGYDGKLEVAQELIENHPGSTCVVFSWYKDVAKRMARMLGVDCITGDMSVSERRRVALANEGKHIVATIGSLTEGVDLSFARVVIFVEEHWPPGANYQAIGRVRRERQYEANDEPVIVYYIQVKDSIDEHIHKVSQGRGDTIRELVRGALGIEP